MIALLTAFLITTAAVSPDTWKIILNNKTLLVTSVENQEKNKLTITRSELLKKGSLQITCTDKGLEKGWKREISVVDNGENELVKRGNNKVS
ncbi:MAG TPA: hypothetical protein VF679_09045, partial [Pedobacter sp.]